MVIMVIMVTRVIMVIRVIRVIRDIMLIRVIRVIRVTSVKSLICILTHQGHISKVNANAHSVSKWVSKWLLSLLERPVTLKSGTNLSLFVTFLADMSYLWACSWIYLYLVMSIDPLMRKFESATKRLQMIKLAENAELLFWSSEHKFSHLSSHVSTAKMLWKKKCLFS